MKNPHIIALAWFISNMLAYYFLGAIPMIFVNFAWAIGLIATL